MAKNKTPDERWTKLSADIGDDFRHDILFSESDRGAVLVAAAFIDEALEHLLRAVLTAKSVNRNESEFPGVLDKLIGSDPNTPFGTFSSRITACYVLGLIDGDYLKSLDELRKLRNAYAHRLKTHAPTQLTREAATKIADNIVEYGVWDISYIGLLPKDVHFDSLIKSVDPYRIMFSVAIWVIIGGVTEKTTWWKNHGTIASPVDRIPKFTQPTYRTE